MTALERRDPVRLRSDPATSPDVAKAFAAADPYVRHGVVKQWRVRPWTTVIGTAMSGVIPFSWITLWLGV